LFPTSLKGSTFGVVFDGRALSKRPTTRAMAKIILEEWDSATPTRDIVLYMFEGAIT